MAELIPVATTEKKGFMPANFYANSTINLEMGYTYKIASTTSNYIYMEFIVNSYTQGLIGEARIRIAKSSDGKLAVKTALSVNGRFQVFYTLNDGETEIFIKVIKCNLLIAPSMDFRLNPYELNLKKEECELPNAAKEFDYEQSDVAELIGISDFFKPKKINNGKDANDAVSSGIYMLQGTALNVPENQDFILVVFRDMDLVSKPILQFAVNYGNIFYYRIKWYDNDWKDWVKVSIVG